MALVDSTGAILFDQVLSQDYLHRDFGGVVPELACRAHAEILPALLREALSTANIHFDSLDAMAVTRGPGLLGSLLIGIGFAKGLAFPRKLPIVGVDHIKAHLRATFKNAKEISGKSLGLVISGGHTHLYQVKAWPQIEQISQTVDDAAGEAFDKGAKLLGLPYPGGPHLERVAIANDRPLLPLTRGPIRTVHPLDFSFSGMKTAFFHLVQKVGVSESTLPNLAASLQGAITAHVIQRMEKALDEEKPDHLMVGGGVSANMHLRDALQDLCESRNVSIHLSPRSLARDNALTVALLGIDLLELGQYSRYPYVDLVPFTRSGQDTRKGKNPSRKSSGP